MGTHYRLTKAVLRCSHNSYFEQKKGGILNFFIFMFHGQIICIFFKQKCMD